MLRIRPSTQAFLAGVLALGPLQEMLGANALKVNQLKAPCYIGA